MARTSLLSAVKSRWYNNATLLSTLPGGLFVNEVPETLEGVAPVLPYAYVESGRTYYQWTHTPQYYEIAEIEFCVFAPGAAVVEAASIAIRNVFDWCSLDFADGISSSTYVQPTRYDIAAEPIRYKDGSLIYRAHMGYECWINRFDLPN